MCYSSGHNNYYLKFNKKTLFFILKQPHFLYYKRKHLLKLL
ncbi:hypothetical protein BACOVA_00263 [Bacteroides ovatus ATCC 8483]|uniref:Uncharacterized protein n=1 Tax=Bacteroides ovatus (strain ATCC 8483 / DSM 1896 / JCM 5824 / BCRC 10623 / CCUG 4943 / NCTC 11153) TaxID=411476 RepID=A0AAN3ACN8_BACO1|nr:hypothetical protein BACOVA_00263 [Bacteroides ovatus ATCC 8483]